jgi:bis(5'-nucleosyl)-tetraphosphatase (symmetrical)
MATYAIGDIQGCFDPFQALLKKLSFNPEKDQLWLAGDIINRGPQSLETLRFIMSLGDSAKVVLGNHECHALAVYNGHKRAHKTDTYHQILDAPDADELFDWIRTRPFFYEDTELDFCMLHAGVPPQWSIEDTRNRAKELEAVLQSTDYNQFLATMYGNDPTFWNDSLSGNDRLRFIINSFTRTRYCDRDGKMDFKEKQAPGSQSSHLIPWFNVPNRKTVSSKILFGHWSTLGIHHENNAFCLDSGCLWGGQLTAMRLEPPHNIIAHECACSLKPND